MSQVIVSVTVGRIFKKNTHACIRRTIGICEKENIKDIFIIIFISEKFKGMKADFDMEIHNGKC